MFLLTNANLPFSICLIIAAGMGMGRLHKIMLAFLINDKLMLLLMTLPRILSTTSVEEWHLIRSSSCWCDNSLICDMQLVMT